MAIRPDYDIGTVTLTSGSSDFTTSGSSLQTAAVQAGDAIIAPSGHVLIIASITGQNSGTLFLPCPPDAAGTGLPLRIRFQPDGSRYQGAVRNLIDLLSSGNLEAFAALVGAAGMVPIFTGVGTMDLADPATFGIQDPNGNLQALAGLTSAADKGIMFTGAGTAGTFDLSPFSRTVLDDADAAAWLNTLGLTGNAIADMLQDSFGVYVTTAFDLNTLTPGARGLYTAVAGSANFPEVSGLWYVETQRMFSGAAARIRQTATKYTMLASDGPVVYMRIRFDATTWGPWRCITGIAGSNANGSFVRTSDGTQICWVDIDLTSTAMSAGSNGMFTPSAAYLSWSFPAQFSANPIVVGTLRRGSGIPRGLGIYSASAVTCNYSPWNGASLSASDTKSAQLVAIGRYV